MQKSGISFCVFIALGFGIGCSQTNTLTPTATGSLLATAQDKPAASLVDGFKDFKFGMTVPELQAVKGACKGFDDSLLRFGMLRGKNCYETDAVKADIEFSFFLATPASTGGERVLVAVKVVEGKYDRFFLRMIDKKLSERYTKTSPWSENELGRLQDGFTALVGSLYAGGQVALIVDTEMGPDTPLRMYVKYSSPEWAGSLHDRYKVKDCEK